MALMLSMLLRQDVDGLDDDADVTSSGTVPVARDLQQAAPICVRAARGQPNLNKTRHDTGQRTNMLCGSMQDMGP